MLLLLNPSMKSEQTYEIREHLGYLTTLEWSAQPFWLKPFLAQNLSCFPDGEVFGLLLFVSKCHAEDGLLSRPPELAPGDSWSAPKVRGLAKGTPAFLVAFSTLAVATSFGGTATQVWASTAASSPTMAPWTVRWHPTKSRRSGGQRTVASGAVAECTGCFGRVRVCSCERFWLQHCSKLRAQLKHGHWQRNSKSVRPSSSVPRTGCPVWSKNASPNKKLRNAGHGWQGFRQEIAPTENVVLVTIPNGAEDPAVVINQLRARVAEIEAECEGLRKKRTRSLSVPSPDMPGVDSMSVLGARARSQVHSYADSHRPRKFSCPEVQSFQPCEGSTSRIVEWCKFVCARYGHRA